MYEILDTDINNYEYNVGTSILVLWTSCPLHYGCGWRYRILIIHSYAKLKSALKTFYSIVFLIEMLIEMGVVLLVALPMQNYFFIIGGKFIERICILTFHNVVHQQVSWFDDHANSSDAVGARLSVHASIVRSLVGDTLTLIVQIISILTTGLLVAVTTN